jgi:hypothetical protein
MGVRVCTRIPVATSEFIADSLSKLLCHEVTEVYLRLRYLRHRDGNVLREWCHTMHATENLVLHLYLEIDAAMCVDEALLVSLDCVPRIQSLLYKDRSKHVSQAQMCGEAMTVVRNALNTFEVDHWETTGIHCVCRFCSKPGPTIVLSLVQECQEPFRTPRLVIRHQVGDRVFLRFRHLR